MFVLLFLHLATVFTGVSLIFGSFAIALLAERAGRPSAIAAMYEVRYDRLIGPILVLGGAFGLLTGITFGYNLLAPWLIIAYVLFAVATVWGVRFSGPLLKDLSAQVAGGASDGEPGPRSGQIKGYYAAFIRDP